MKHLSLFVCLASPGIAVAQCELERLLPAGSGFEDEFGWSVAIDGDRALVSAYRDQGWIGVAYVYERDALGWQETAQLRASDGVAGDYFGFAVALDGKRALVGAHGKDGSFERQGAAYLFERDGSGWHESAKLLAADPDGGDQFGWAVALHDDEIFVSAFANDATGENAGSVYAFRPEGTSWLEKGRYEASDASPEDLFGWALDFDGTHMVVGAPLQGAAGGHHQDWGAVYVFARAGETWTETARLVGSDTDRDDWLGYSLAVDGERLIAGAPFAEGADTFSGAAYVFGFDGAGWTEEAKLHASGPGGLERFGHAVDLHGVRAIAGAPGDATIQDSRGRVVVFERRGSTWTPTLDFCAPSVPVNGRFGIAVALSGDHALAGGNFASYVRPDEGQAHAFRIGAGVHHCSSEPNSSGAVARVFAEGCAQRSAHDLVLVAAPLPEQFGLFFFGRNRLDLPFGNGRLCVGGGIERLLPPAVAHGGMLVRAVDYGTPPGNELTAGTTWSFQAWFRDPLGGGAGFDLSDAIELTIQP